MNITKEKLSYQNSTKDIAWKLVPGPFNVYKELRTTTFRNLNLWKRLIVLDIEQQNYQNMSKSACRLPKILFYKGVNEKLEKKLELVSRPHFFQTFSIEMFLLYYK